MEFQDHRYWLRTYPNCIVGKELVNWLLRNGTISTRFVVVVSQMLHSNFTIVVILIRLLYWILKCFGYLAMFVRSLWPLEVQLISPFDLN